MLYPKGVPLVDSLGRMEGFKLIDMGLRLFILLCIDGKRIYVQRERTGRRMELMRAVHNKETPHT